MKLPDFKLERYFADWEFKASYLLCSSDLESMSIKDLLAYEPEAAEEMHGLWLGYTESAGNPALRASIAGLYQQIEPSQTLVFSGAEEAIFIFMNAVLEKGDHLIVHYPSYQSLFEIADAIGCEVTRWQAQEESGWSLDLDFLESSIRPNTRAIVINCPHNPTGYLMNRSDFERLIEIARRHNMLLFSDEVYRLLEYDLQTRLPAACDLYENAVSLGVMSKAYGLAGLRIGWIATQNREIFKQSASFKDYTTICNSAPSEFLATLALRHSEKILARNVGIIQKNLPLLDRFFEQWQDYFQWQKPLAGPIAFPHLQKDLPVTDFCRKLVEKKGVLLLPGTLYDGNSNNFRLGFGRKNMPEALQRLEDFLREL
ncbi:aminotransferase class I/II-fold pyridoxal phosphate-dependent enzyme [Candidatus Chlorohelix sp.]|uniref:aminotransferase class I/II-fold pyridoxal phosphate-dependent enzyme n=1 Tax=Candidatus Chlorohelix sp. TaxID=3139201 RepID=UPI00305BD37A